MEIIRTLKKEELEDSIRLSCFAFQYEVSPEEKEERIRQTDPETVWGCFVDGKLAAKMTIHPLRTYIQGRPYAMGGVAGVATWPEYRRQGFVAKLLLQGLKAMKEKGQTVSFLHPFSIPFYRKYGWELFTDYKTYEIDVTKLPTLPHPEGTVERVSGDWRLLDHVYQAFAAQYNGTLVRDEAWWTRKVRPDRGMAAVYRDPEGQARGYLLYTVKNRIMQIAEWIWLDVTARLGLLKFVCNHDSMFDKIVMKAPADDLLPFLLHDPRVKQELWPYFMARIVDVKSFVEQYAFEAPEADETLYIRVEDAQAPWNDGAFRLDVDREGRATANVMPSDAPQGEGALRCDIGALTAMLMGYRRPAEYARLGRLRGEEPAVRRFERLVPRRATYLPDYF
jgi:predicted acetyltransferase